MEIDPGKVLNEAREAFRNKEYSRALEKYEWFFENSIQIKRSYYGVRLSYCLSEWVELGTEHPPALEALENKKKEALASFIKSKSRNDFHDYSSICFAIGCSGEAVEVFRELRSTDFELSKELFTFVYEKLARNSEWALCREYLGNGYKQYKKLLKLFDACIKGAEKIGGEQGESIKKTTISNAVEGLLWLLNMQAYANADEEIESALKQIELDFNGRKHSAVYQKVLARAPNQTKNP